MLKCQKLCVTRFFSRMFLVAVAICRNFTMFFERGEEKKSPLSAISSMCIAQSNVFFSLSIFTVDFFSSFVLQSFVSKRADNNNTFKSITKIYGLTHQFHQFLYVVSHTHFPFDFSLAVLSTIFNNTQKKPIPCFDGYLI